MGGCLSQQEQKAAPAPAKPQPPPIPVQRQKEAQNNFGLKNRTVIKPLGVGGTGETFLCRHNEDGTQQAVKVIRRPIPPSLQKLLTNEIILQASLGEGHANIVAAHEVLLTETHLCLFMEYVAGGTLTDYVSVRADTIDQRGGLFLDEDEARYLFHQCIDAVDFCHKRNVAHRDLKLDNTLLDLSKPPHIKICDFGFARLMGKDNLTTNIGTPVYMAPQLIKKGRNGYDGRAVDVWACGVLLYVMLLGAFPFEHSATAATDEQRAFNEVHFEQIRVHWTENERNKEIVKRMSAECVDLLDQIFQIDESKRIKISEIKTHPWYKKALSPKYAKALEELQKYQQKLDKDEELARESAGRKLKDSTITEVVARACSKESNPQTIQLEGREIMLKRTPTHGALPAMPEEDDAHDSTAAPPAVKA